jgi:hypothetical protein
VFFDLSAALVLSARRRPRPLATVQETAIFRVSIMDIS